MVPLEQILGYGPGMNFVERVTVKVGLGKILNIEVTLDPPLDVALNILRKGLVGFGFTLQAQKPSQSSTANSDTAAPAESTVITLNKIAVRLWNGSISSPWFTGLLFQPDISVGPEGITITMQAFGMIFESSKTYVGKHFPSGTKKIEIIKTLIENDNINLKFSSGAQSILSETITEDYVSSKTNWETAKELLSSWNCGLYVLGSKTEKDKQTVYVFGLSEPKKNKKVAASFVAFRQIDPANRVFPLISFSSPLQNLFIPNVGAFGTKATQISKSEPGKVSRTDTSAGGKSFHERSTQTSSSTIAGSLDRTNNFSNRPEQSEKQIPAPSESQHFIDTVKGYMHDFVERAFEYHITSIGVPDIFPGSRVNIAVSDIRELSGEYDVYEVTHEVSSGGYQTSLHCMRTKGFASIIDKGLEVAKSTGVAAASSANKKVSSGAKVSVQ